MTEARQSLVPPARLTFPLLVLCALACLWPAISSGLALLLGVAFAFIFGNPELVKSKSISSRLLSLSVIGLGAGMNLLTVARVGLHGFGYTVASLSVVFALGFLLKRLLRVESTTSLLVTVGTAICGGSAIAAVAPVLRAKSSEISVSLGIVFILNAAALFLFPPLGHCFELTQTQFGLWAALAIHDTSSVVGAGLQYGPQALEVATTVKLARALWIVPVTLFIASRMRAEGAGGDGGGQLVRIDGGRAGVIDGGATGKVAAKTKKPWFILGFLLMAALVTFVPSLQSAGHIVELVARRALVMTLFFIGSQLTVATLKQVGPRPLIQGFVLWILAASLSLAAIKAGWIG